MHTHTHTYVALPKAIPTFILRYYSYTHVYMHLFENKHSYTNVYMCMARFQKNKIPIHMCTWTCLKIKIYTLYHWF